MEIKVGMADMNVCSGDDSIITLGLGSCVGVVLWDPSAKVCGMVHVMLPDSTAISQNTNRAKFADTGLTANTQEEEIDFQSASLTAQLFRDDSNAHNWKRVADAQTSEADAEDVLKAFLGITA